MEKKLITYRGAVYPWQCDHMGHMNVMWYVGKFDEASWHLLAAIGITPSYLRKQQRGMAALQQEITYKKELQAGSIITIQSSILEMKNKIIRFSHEMFNEESGELAAALTETAIHLDTQSRKSCPFPEEIKRRFEKLRITI